MPARLARLLPLGLLALLFAAAPADASVPRGPAGAAFYKPPSPLPGRGHGDPIRARALTGSAVLTAARRNLRVLYRSAGVAGRPVAVSGAVSLPPGRAPRGGWPVITWAHGTTGIADACAPSRDASLSGRGANAYVADMLNRWLKAGWAVVRTDYEGLGTPGVHPYLIGRSEGRSTLDMVRAARRLAPSLGRRVVVAGHSQGGHAALWAAALAPKWTPELAVRGTVAFAPANHLGEQIPASRFIGSPGGGLSALIASVVRGLDAGDAQVDPKRLLSDRALRLYGQTNLKCLGTLARADSYGGLAPKELFRADAPFGFLGARLDRQDPETLTIRTPVMVEQGAKDATVLKPFTDRLVPALRERGGRVRYDVFPDSSHVGIVFDASALATRWMRGKLAP